MAPRRQRWFQGAFPDGLWEWFLAQRPEPQNPARVYSPHLPPATAQATCRSSPYPVSDPLGSATLPSLPVHQAKSPPDAAPAQATGLRLLAEKAWVRAQA